MHPIIMKIDTQEVITAVQSTPVLWDKTCHLYRNNEARERSWTEISRQLVPNYDSFSLRDRKDIEQKVQQRWRTARDTYTKYKLADRKYGIGKHTKKKYVYHDMLTFLDGNKPDEEVPSASFVNVDVDWMEESSADASGPQQFLSQQRSNELELDSEDLAFYQSLQPTLKRFTNYQKMQFRAKVLHIIMEMENPGSPSSQTASSSTESCKRVKQEELSS